MREIKFRAWDKEMKMMHICGEDEHDSIHFLMNQACYYNLQNGCGSLPKELGEGSYELMQYTGLKDKNGKEIYESDIVRTVALNNDHHQKDATSILTVKYFMGNPCLCETGYETGVAIYPFCVSHEMKIIGNIHKNSELVKS